MRFGLAVQTKGFGGRCFRRRSGDDGLELVDYSPHAPEVECIAKDKAHRPYEFGVKVSVATDLPLSVSSRRS
jgi:hypothetical protein